MPVNYGHHGSANMAALLHPLCGIRDEQRRRGLTPRNHARDNVLLIREIQRKNAERKSAAAEAAASTPHPSPRFRGVGSKVASELARPSSAPSLKERPKQPPPFMAGKPAADRTGIATAWAVPPLLESEREGAPSAGVAATLVARATTKPPVPSAAELARPASARAEKDFVARNVSNASRTPRRGKKTPAASPETTGKTHQRGRLPAYLLDRKLEMAKEAAEREAAAKPRECPEGTHVMPEEERHRVLELVRSNREKVNALLDAMPFVIDSYGLKTKHKSLMKQLAELDDADRTFSRKKVIVADDAPRVVVPPVDVA
ncbi:hypothetical protein AB1Y20_008269 [Prymnesium parvum]|uniref:Enkurin domain-containing protein n=1 Tax=Prymnesium parvum TaxID=97485 RepID=A0AB34IU68_PRYPA